MTAASPSDGSTWLDLAARVCVVTGAGSGIGAETARQLAALGAHVAVLDRNPSAAAAVAAEIASTGGRAISVEADVTQPAAVATAATQVMQQLGACQVLVNNAAIQPNPEALMALNLDHWNQLLAVNLTGALVCAQVFGAQMIAARRGGCMIHIASVGGEHALPRSGAYSVSKAGMMMLSRMLTLELAEHRIRSNVVAPALIRTPASDHLYSDPDVVARRNQLIPAGRVSDPIDVANVIAFMASDRAGYINGQQILVDGGLTQILMTLVPRPGPPRT